VDDRTLRIQPREGALRYEVDQMMRSPRIAPFAAGDTYSLPNIRVDIEAVTPDHHPLSMRAHFAVPLDDPSFVWLRWESKGYASYVPPAVGAKETLPAVDFWKLLED
jgi:hypothetical protein